MAQTQMKKVGKIMEAHSLKGEVYVFIFSGDVSWVDKLESFELRKNETDTQGIEFTVERFRKHKKGIILKAKELADRTAAEKYEKWFLFVPEEMFDSSEDEDGSIYLSEIEGFLVKTESGEELGVIIGFSSNIAQDLLVVEKENKKFEIPFVQEFIVEINFDEKFIIMDLPPGLLEINS